MTKSSLFREYLHTSWKRKIAVIVVLLIIPIAWIADGLSWASEKMYDFGYFIERWMKIWTGSK